MLQLVSLATPFVFVIIMPQWTTVHGTSFFNFLDKGEALSKSGDRGDPVDPFITEPLNFDTRVKEGDGDSSKNLEEIRLCLLLAGFVWKQIEFHLVSEQNFQEAVNSDMHSIHQ
ncbi:hypothetical protein ACJX0J_030962 [Zea mays]